MLELALLGNDETEIRKGTASLRGLLAELEQPELEERLNYWMYRGLDWLKSQKLKVGDPLSYLESAYEVLLRKASHLDPQARHRFLFQVADHQAILKDASRHQLVAEGKGP